MYALSRTLWVLALVAFGLLGCGKRSVESARTAEETAVLAQSSFFQGELTPAADPLLQSAATSGDGGFIPAPPTTGGSDSGNIPAPGGNPSPGDGGVVQNPNPGTPTNPPADGGGVVQNPPAPSDPGTGGTTPTTPNTPPSDGGVVQNPPAPSNPGDGGDIPNPGTPTNPGDGGVVQNPPTPSNPGDGGNVPAPGTPTNPGDGGVVQNPPTPNNPGDGGNVPTPGTPTNPPGDGGVVQNPPTPNNPGDGGNVPAPGNPTNPPGDGGVVQNPPTPGTPGDSGTAPCTNPANCVGVDVTLNRVCSERRSAIAYPHFIFFEEARRPILTLESTVNACTNTRHSLASMGTSAPHPMESQLINLLLNPLTRSTNRQNVLFARKGLQGVSLSHSKYRTRLQLAMQTIKSWFPSSWQKIYVNAHVCDDSNNDGLCTGEPTVRNLMAQESGFKLSRVPREMKLMVWNGRSNTLRENPQDCEMQISPLVLDLNGDGFRFTSPQKGVLFDLNDEGEQVLTAWTVSGADDVFVVRDIDRNGTIDTGAELFGSATRLKSGARAANGFDALADLDSNANGVFDPKDAAWPEIGVWLDRNHNGVSERGELYSLNRAGVQSINLEYLNAQEIDAHGNETRQRSTYHRQVQGASALRQVIDIWFSTLKVD